MSRFKIDGEKSARKMLADAIGSMGTVQRKLQALIEWGTAHAEKHGDHTFLCDLYKQAYAKNRRTGAQIQMYLFDLLNLEKQVVKENGEDVVKFARVQGEDGKKLPLVRDREVLTKNWWEYKKAADTSQFDVEALEKYLENKLKSAKASEGVRAYCERFLEEIRTERTNEILVAELERKAA